MFYKYRTDLGNTVTAKSTTSFTGLTGNEAQISSTIDTSVLQPLQLYKVSGGILVDNDESTINNYLISTGTVTQGTPSYVQFTGYTATTAPATYLSKTNFSSYTGNSNTTYYKYNVGSSVTITNVNKVFVGQATTDSSGVATFHMTLNGLSGGTAIFSSIHSIETVAQNNTSSVGSIPLVAIKNVTNGKTVTVNVVNPITIILGGLGLTFAGSGITVHLTVRGT